MTRRSNARHGAVPASFLVLVVVLGIAGLGAWSPSRSGAGAQEATPAGTPPASVDAPLTDVSGTDVGTLSLREGDDGVVTVSVAVEGLPPGDFGIHVHAMGECDPAGEQPFASAGPHYNPTGGEHGGAPSESELATPGGDPTIHAGDLGSIEIADDGTGSFEARTPRFTLSAGSVSVFDEDGSSLIIHDMTDDLVSQPAGDSGGRVVCGVVAPPLVMPGTPVAAAEAFDVEGVAFNPEELPFTDDLLGRLQLPDGFEISVYAQGMGNPRMMAYGPDGTLYVTQPEENNVLGLRDADADGAAEESFTAASNLPRVHGILFHEGLVYLAGLSQVWSAEIGADGTFGTPQVVLDELPGGGQHPNRTIAIGPDGMLYLTLGSTCNVCDEPDEENATIVRANLDGTGREIFASGLRNTLGFGWHPETGELWGSDMGSDWRGDDQPPDEFNRLVEDGNYGWPYCFAEQQPDRYSSFVPVGATFAQYCANTEPSTLTYQAHSSPIALVYYTADAFPADYQGDAFVALRGSWNREPAVGYKVVRVRFEDGQPVAIDDFVTGWLTEDGAAHFGRIAGLLVAGDGSLLISEDTNGVIYRVTYAG